MSIRRFGLISDTHGRVHREVAARFEGVEAILHAGDVGGDHVLGELGLIAPVHAIAGNVDDPAPQLPETRLVQLPFGCVGMAHGHQLPSDRESRFKGLHSLFSGHGPRILMHGHTHLPLMDFRDTRAGGVWVVNPGSASQPRFGGPAMLCVLHWDSDRDLLSFDFQSLLWS